MKKYKAKQDEIYYCAICEDGKLFPKDKCQTCKTTYEDAVPLSEREDLPYWTEPKPYFKIVD